jgi:hypothetical protein
MVQCRLRSTSKESSNLEELVLSKIFIKSISSVDQLEELLGLRQSSNSSVGGPHPLFLVHLGN